MIFNWKKFVFKKLKVVRSHPIIGWLRTRRLVQTLIKYNYLLITYVFNQWFKFVFVGFGQNFRFFKKENLIKQFQKHNMINNYFFIVKYKIKIKLITCSIRWNLLEFRIEWIIYIQNKSITFNLAKILTLVNTCV